METSLPIIAGFASTTLFAVGTLPMLVKAFQTKDLTSYSLGNLVLSNVGNLIYSLYVFQLPPGPVWFLHIYNLVTTALMLFWYFKYEGFPALPEFVRNNALMRFIAPPCCPGALS